MSARSWNVSRRKAGPPILRAYRAMAPKSSPALEATATTWPSMALGISASVPAGETHFPSAKLSRTIGMSGYSLVNTMVLGSVFANGIDRRERLHRRKGADLLIIIPRAASACGALHVILRKVVDHTAI